MSLETYVFKEEEIEIEKIDSSYFSLRKIDEEFLKELMNSIKYCGLLQPILVRRSGDRFVVIAGNHRLEACKRLGWKKIKALVTDISLEESFLLQVAENLQRNTKINVVAEARGYKWLIERGWTLNQIAKKIGKSDKYVSARIRIIEKLHPYILEKLSLGKYKHLTPSHAEQLALINDQSKQLELARIIEEEKLSVHELEGINQTLIQESKKELQNVTNVPLKSLDRRLFIANTRVGIIPEEVLTIITRFYGRRGEIIGRKIGRTMRKIILKMRAKQQASLLSKNLFISHIHSMLGLGEIYLNDEKVIIKESIIKNYHFLKGYLEGVLNLSLSSSDLEEDQFNTDHSIYIFYLRS
ncbi:MAG: ParB/RepB/Spo0J family partition protein [Nitrososphaeria archaeon]